MISATSSPFSNRISSIPSKPDVNMWWCDNTILGPFPDCKLVSSHCRRSLQMRPPCSFVAASYKVSRKRILVLKKFFDPYWKPVGRFGKAFAKVVRLSWFPSISVVSNGWLSRALFKILYSSYNPLWVRSPNRNRWQASEWYVAACSRHLLNLSKGF